VPLFGGYLQDDIQLQQLLVCNSVFLRLKSLHKAALPMLGDLIRSTGSSGSVCQLVRGNLSPFFTAGSAKHNLDNIVLLISNNAPHHPVSVEEN
jgi:hypothetical protein